jgi:predicted porin
MNKKLMAVAVAGALAAPAVAFAQASNVQIYGRANLGIDVFSATGATAGSASDWKSRTRTYDNGSRLGVMGSEDLGGGLKAIFLMENGVAMDTGNGNGQNGGNNTSVGLAARLAYVGLAGGWGQVTLGKQNVFWANGQHEQWQANWGSVGNQFFTGGGGRGMGVNVNRTANVMQYQSPVWSGVSVKLQYAPTAQELAPAGAKADGRIAAITVEGNHPGGLIWAWDYVDNRANSLASGGQPRNQGNKLRGGWLYAPGANISLFFVQNKVDKNGTGINSGAGTAASAATVSGTGLPEANDLKQQGWGVVWEHMFGNIGVEANWSKQSNITGCSVSNNCANTDNTTYFLGGRYNLSKRTSLLAFYLQYKNGSNYNSDPAAGGMSSVVAPLANGADPKVYGVGILHNF